MQCTNITVPDQSLNSAGLRVNTHACMLARAHTDTHTHTHTHTHTGTYIQRIRNFVRMNAGCGISHKNTKYAE